MKTTQSTIRFTGSITAAEPFSTTFPKAQADTIFDFETRKRVDSYLQKGTMPIVRDGVVTEEPIISATALKSRIRHACADAIIFAKAASGNKVSLKDLYLMKVGQDADAKSNKEKLEDGESTMIDIGAIEEFRANNPVPDQFGLFELTGNLAFSAGIAQTRAQTEYMGGVRHDIPVGYIDAYADGNAKDEYMDRRVNNTKLSQAKTSLEELERELKKVRTDAKLKKGEESEQTKKLNEKIAAAEVQIKELETLQGDTKISTQMPIPARHIAPIGTVFNQTITINDGSKRGLSMVAHGLNALAKNPKMGAYKSSCGLIRASWEVAVITDGVKDVKGTFEFGQKFDGNGKLVRDDYENAQFIAVDANAQAWWDEQAKDVSWIV